MVAELPDEVGVGSIIEMADEMGRESGVVEELVEESSIDRDVTCVRRHGHEYATECLTLGV